MVERHGWPRGRWFVKITIHLTLKARAGLKFHVTVNDHEQLWIHNSNSRKFTGFKRSNLYKLFKSDQFLDKILQESFTDSVAKVGNTFQHEEISPHKHTSLTCAWKRDRLLTVWRGINTLTRNCLCSAFSGRAKPLIILEKRGTKIKESKYKLNMNTWKSFIVTPWKPVEDQQEADRALSRNKQTDGTEARTFRLRENR